MLASKRFLAGLLTVFLVGMALSSLGLSGIPSIPSAHAITRSLTLIGYGIAPNGGGWNATTNKNPTITVAQNDALSIHLSSGDAALHQFFVDVDHSGISPNCTVDKCSNPFPPSTVYNFTVNFATGNYKYYCTYHPFAMVGNFTVNPPPTIGGAPLPVDKLNLVAPYVGLASAVGLVLVAAAIVLRRKNKD